MCAGPPARAWALREKGYHPIGQIVGYILTEDPAYITNHKQARQMIREIQVKLELLKKYPDAAVGKCAFCGYPIYVDKNRYEMDSGEMIHGVCMERFIRSPVSGESQTVPVSIPRPVSAGKDTISTS